MSRHRNIRKLNIQEELESDDDADYYGRSLEDESDIFYTPETSQFVKSRPHLTYKLTEANNSIINKKFSNSNKSDNNDKNEDENEIFMLDKMDITTKKEKPKNTETLEEKTTFVIGEPKPQTPVHTTLKTTPLPSTIENLRVFAIKPEKNNSKSPLRITPNSSFQRLTALDIALATVSNVKHCVRDENFERSINLVIVGHVDAGKSTLVGHLLYLLGNVDNKTMHKNQQESARAGKSSFAFAWILDEGEEERARGVTMDIARISFQSKKRVYNILDAPGHKDFIPNMITGASQADAALLVINATKGEFETGYNQGGQTREHALLLRSMGVSKIIVAVNKLDTIEWSEDRFNEICDSLKLFLHKQAGLKDIKFIPLSGLLGINLVKHPPADHLLSAWYKDGLTLLDAFDSLPSPVLLESKPLRIVINDILKLTVNTINLVGKVEAGFIESGEKLFLMPDANPVTIKSIVLDNISNNFSLSKTQQQQQSNIAFSGDYVLLTATGLFEPDSIYPGYVLCRGGSELLVPTKKFSAQIVVFDIRIPIIKGTRAELFVHLMRVSCSIICLKSVINKSTRKTIKTNPRLLTKNMSAIIEIQTDLPINIEPYPKTLSRFTLRNNNQTIAAGIVENVL